MDASYFLSAFQNLSYLNLNFLKLVFLIMFPKINIIINYFHLILKYVQKYFSKFLLIVNINNCHIKYQFILFI